MNEMEMRLAVAREDLCRLTAACYYEPDPAFEEEGLFDSILAAAKLLDGDLALLAGALRDSFRTARPDELLLDHARLFLGPMEILAQPYASVWLTADKTLMGETSMAVLAMYEEGGFELDEEFRELPDHIAAEMEFLYLLIFRENEARLVGETEKMGAAIALRKRFLGEHLVRWLPSFSAAIGNHADQDFYRHLATLTEKVVGLEMARTNSPNVTVR